jgi:hypothetical protein
MDDCTSPKYVPDPRVGVAIRIARGAAAVDGERMDDCTSPSYVRSHSVGVAIRTARGAAIVDREKMDKSIHLLPTTTTKHSTRRLIRKTLLTFFSNDL